MNNNTSLKQMGSHLITFCLLILTSLPSTMCFYQAVKAESPGACEVKLLVFKDGYVFSTYKVYLTQAGFFKAYLCGYPLNETIIVIPEGNKTVLWDYNASDNSITLISTNGCEVEIHYWTLTLTSKTNESWVFKASINYPTKIIFPQPIILIPSIEPVDVSMSSENVTLTYPPTNQSIEIEYFLLPSKMSPIPPQKPTSTLIPFQLNLQLTILMIVVAVSTVTVIVATLLIKSRFKRREISLLDDRDKMIINFIKSKGGKAFQKDIASELNIPKSVVSRKIKKLSKLGLVKVEKTYAGNIVYIE